MYQQSNVSVSVNKYNFHSKKPENYPLFRCESISHQTQTYSSENEKYIEMYLFLNGFFLKDRIFGLAFRFQMCEANTVGSFPLTILAF